MSYCQSFWSSALRLLFHCSVVVPLGSMRVRTRERERERAQIKIHANELMFDVDTGQVDWVLTTVRASVLAWRERWSEWSFWHFYNLSIHLRMSLTLTAHTIHWSLPNPCPYTSRSVHLEAILFNSRNDLRMLSLCTLPASICPTLNSTKSEKEREREQSRKKKGILTSFFCHVAGATTSHRASVSVLGLHFVGKCVCCSRRNRQQTQTSEAKWIHDGLPRT